MATLHAEGDGAHLAETSVHSLVIQWRFYTLLWEARNQRTMTFQKQCTPYWFNHSMTLFLHSESLRCVLLNDVKLTSSLCKYTLLHALSHIGTQSRRHSVTEASSQSHVQALGQAVKHHTGSQSHKQSGTHTCSQAVTDRIITF